jgi:hypothetical protein
MLCWEKPGEGCHRRICAEWLETALGIVVPEFGLPREDCLPYALMGRAAKKPRKRATGQRNLPFLGDPS